MSELRDQCDGHYLGAMVLNFAVTESLLAVIAKLLWRAIDLYLQPEL